MTSAFIPYMVDEISVNVVDGISMVGKNSDSLFMQHSFKAFVQNSCSICATCV